jgi:hypothetical protein
LNLWRYAGRWTGAGSRPRGRRRARSECKDDAGREHNG